jgi:hypothetical protein
MSASDQSRHSAAIIFPPVADGEAMRHTITAGSTDSETAEWIYLLLYCSGRSLSRSR